MARYARINENNIVVQVTEAPENWLTDPNRPDDGATWIKGADENGGFRKNSPHMDYTWDAERDAFIPEKNFNSWVLNETTCVWEPPTPNPGTIMTHRWDEETTSWVERT